MTIGIILFGITVFLAGFMTCLLCIAAPDDELLDELKKEKEENNGNGTKV